MSHTSKFFEFGDFRSHVDWSFTPPCNDLGYLETGTVLPIDLKLKSVESPSYDVQKKTELTALKIFADSKFPEFQTKGEWVSERREIPPRTSTPSIIEDQNMNVALLIMDHRTKKERHNYGFPDITKHQIPRKPSPLSQTSDIIV
jgi:hypothetical protein